MSELQTLAPKIVDVIAKKSKYSDQTFYYIVVDQPVRYVYERSPVVETQAFARSGQSFFLGQCGDFYAFLSGTERKGEAFAGRSFDINLSDGTTFHCQGDVWACGPRKSDPPVVQCGVASLEELKRCYVFCGGHVKVNTLNAWLAEHEPASDYYKYDDRPPRIFAPTKPRRQRSRNASYRKRRTERRAIRRSWLPIESAPRDGTWVEACGPTRRAYRAQFRKIQFQTPADFELAKVLGACTNDSEAWICDDGKSLIPILWRPINHEVIS